MKIVEALKKVKDNRRKIEDLKKKIRSNAARLSYESSPYPNPSQKVESWVQSCRDLSLESVDLLERISRTNNAVEVTIEVGGNTITRTISGWVYRRREFAKLDLSVQQCLTTGVLKEGTIDTANGEKMDVTIIRHFDTEVRDNLLESLSEEPFLIDSRLEIVNATTDLVN